MGVGGGDTTSLTLSIIDWIAGDELVDRRVVSQSLDWVSRIVGSHRGLKDNRKRVSDSPTEAREAQLTQSLVRGLDLVERDLLQTCPGALDDRHPTLGHNIAIIRRDDLCPLGTTTAASVQARRVQRSSTYLMTTPWNLCPTRSSFIKPSRESFFPEHFLGSQWSKSCSPSSYQYPVVQCAVVSALTHPHGNGNSTPSELIYLSLICETRTYQCAVSPASSPGPHLHYLHHLHPPPDR